MNESRVILLGGRGFVGANLKEELRSADLNVICVTSSDADLRTPMGATALSGIVRDGDIVVNCAAVVPARDTADVMENVRIVESTLAGLARVQLEQLVVVSSDAVYGDVSGVITAQTPVSADSYYSAMCVVREVAAQETASRATAIIRPAAIYGAGDSHNSYGPNRFIQTGLKDHEITIFGQGEASRDHVHISDVSKAIVHAITSRLDGIFNIGSGSAVSFHDVAKIVREAIGNGVEIQSAGAESAVTHRYMDLEDIRSWFPMFTPTIIRSGVTRVVDELRV